MWFMKNLEATYQSLISLENLKGLTNETALERIGQLTDFSLDLQKTNGLEHAIKLSKELQKRRLTAGQLATSHYFLANAWANLRVLSRTENERWDWEQKEIEKQIIHLRMALHENGLHELPDVRVCQILTNLGNVLDLVGRFVEAIEYWDRALKKLPSFVMARGNRGISLTAYAKALYDQGHKSIFLKHAHTELETALLSELHKDAKKEFQENLVWIESVLSSQFIKKDLDLRSFSLGASEQEIRYRRWCLENRLFLNPLNDLGSYPIAAQDVLTTPSIAVKIGEGPYYLGYYNQMKQEFVSARYQYYEGISSKQQHFSDKDVLLYNTLDYPTYSLAVEKVKSAFRTAYSLFDKIAYFLKHYLNLSIPKTRVYFKTLWYTQKRKNKYLRPDFQVRQNWPLRGLFWLSKDLFEPDFKESIEPDAQAIYEIRNHLEHKYLKVHDDLWKRSPENNNRISLVLADTLAFSTYRREFEAKTLRLLKLVRAALIYLSLAINVEEHRRAKERGPDDIVPRIQLDIWKNEWKI